MDRRIESWSEDYLRPWPELLRKQVDEYEKAGENWRSVARARVFPALGGRLRSMDAVHNGLRPAIPTAVRRCRDELGLNFPVTFVVYVGLGCGAGWATDFRGAPAVLLGVENAAELGWKDPTTLVALVEHEVAHLLHDRWRHRAGKGRIADHRGPWWQLYVEGFATRCERSLGDIGLHHSTGPKEDWLAWCTENRSRLAALFVRSAHSPRRIRRFFGSWYPMDGHIETGYFLGSEVVREWESTYELREIARWGPDRVRRRAQSLLKHWATA